MRTQKSIHQVLNHSTMTVFQRHIIKQDKRNTATRFFHSKDDKAVIATCIDNSEQSPTNPPSPITSMSSIAAEVWT